MTIFQLDCFLTLSQTLNFTRAAQLQFITQPALSRSISALEDELGVQLLERSRNSVALTSAGKVFANECKHIISACQKGIQDAQAISSGTTGTLRMGAAFDSYEPLTIKLINALRERHTGINVELKFSSADGLIKLIDDNLADMIVASGKSKRSDINSMLIDCRRIHIVLPSYHPLADCSSVSFSELSNEDFVAISHVMSLPGYESLIEFASRSGFVPHITGEADTVSGLLMMVGAGKGITILYRQHEPYSNDQIRFIPLDDDYYFNRYLIWNNSSNPLMDMVIQTAKEIFKCDSIPSDESIPEISL